MKIATAIVLGVALAATGTVAFAARNTAGTFSVTAVDGGYPFIKDRTISSSGVNNNFGELMQGLTDSLDRNGKGGMNAPLRVPNGTVTAPTISFTNETGTGLYRVGAGNPAMSVLGSKRQEWTSTGTVVTGTFNTTGDATIGGASTFTGAAGFSAAPTFNSGAFVAAGGFTFSATGDQTIAKTGGNLNINVPTGQVFGIQLNGVTKWQMDGTGKFGGDGTNVITGVASPSGTSDVATKGYVDGADASASLVAGANITIANAQLYRIGGSLIVLRALVTSSTTTAAGTSRTLFTIPAGYRPLTAPTVAVLLWDSTAKTLGAVNAQSDGMVFTVTGITAGDSYSFSMAFTL